MPRTDGGRETDARGAAARGGDGEEGGVEDRPARGCEGSKRGKGERGSVGVSEPINQASDEVEKRPAGEKVPAESISQSVNQSSDAHRRSWDLAVEGSPTMSTLMSPRRCVPFARDFSTPGKGCLGSSGGAVGLSKSVCVCAKVMRASTQAGREAGTHRRRPGGRGPA